MFLESQLIDELAQRLCALLPTDPDPAMAQALAPQFRQLLYGGLQRLDLVGRGEYEVLRLALLRARERLEQVECRLCALEAESESAADPG